NAENLAVADSLNCCLLPDDLLPIITIRLFQQTLNKTNKKIALEISQGYQARLIIKNFFSEQNSA
ncbi:hypothetical protein, partial [Okeania sp. SIO2B9]|uniref:hypothetical protein n=1 Tax=Okeania sp. SIO2B9 TaxID=2607782 RepID=UPI00257D507F